MPDSIGEEKTWGQLDNLWHYVTDCNLKLIRIGGIAYDEYFTSNYQIISLIDSIRSIGAEPLIQVSYNDGMYTANQAAQMVNYVNNTMNRNIKYWSIANEPVLGYSASSDEISTYFKEFSTEMKQTDASIKIVGPDLAWYNETILNDLIGGSEDITGTDSYGNYYIDIVSFHAYPFDGTQTKQDVINVYNSYLKPSVENLVNKITNANSLHSRTGTDSLTWAITEFNINYANPSQNIEDGLGANSFINGQLWAETFSLGMEFGAEFVCPWSIHESSGNASTYDLGFLSDMPGNIDFRSSYYHEQLLANNTRNYFANYYSNIAGVKTFGNYNNDSISVVILNMNDQAYNYEVFHNETSSSAEELQINTNSLNIQQSFADVIDANCTQLLVFNSNGEIAKKYTYCLGNDYPVLTEYQITTFANNNTKQLNIFPNPFKNNINLTLNKSNIVNIYNNLGVRVFSKNIKSDLHKIDLSFLDSGIYIIEVYSDKYKVYRNIIIKK